MGNLTRISDSQGNSINYTYDSEGNKLTEEIKDAGGSLQKSLSYSYDALNRLSRGSRIRTAAIHEYSYDFGATGRAPKTRTAIRRTYSYDALNRLDRRSPSRELLRPAMATTRTTT